MSYEAKTTKHSELVDEWPNIEKLIEVCGGNQTEAARHIGLTGSGLNTILSRRKVKLPYELAAATVLRRMSVAKEAEAMIVVKCSPPQKAALMTLISAMGCQHLDLDL